MPLSVSTFSGTLQIEALHSLTFFAREIGLSKAEIIMPYTSTASLKRAAHGT